MARRAPVVLLALFGVTLAAPACTRDAGPPLVPAHRLIEHQQAARDDDALERGRYVALDEVSRPTLAAARPFRVEPACPADASGPAARCSVTVPPELASVRWLLVDVARAPRGQEDVPPVRLLHRGGEGSSVALPAELARREIRRVELRGVPDLDTRMITTAPLDVPAGARLRFAVAIEPGATLAGTAPVELLITAFDETEERVVFRRTLDPLNEVADRGWSEHDVPLDALAGRSIRLRFASRAAGGASGRPALPVWADPTVWIPRARADDGRPSVVLVSLDTLRARSMSTYGHARETTPYLTELAGEGALFERAFTTFSNTLGSHMSMMTGLLPASHGVVALDRPLPPGHATLAERLRDAGYATAAFTENGLLEGGLGFQRGFATYAANKGVFSAAGDAAGTFARALGWARAHAGTPFFLFVHTYAVHLPYAPPDAYAGLFIEGEPAASRPPVERELLRYEQEIRALDDEVRRLVDGLAAIVPRDRLLLVVTSDHGEEFGEHGQVTHLQLYDEVMHVPLLVRMPGRVAPGGRIATPASLTDLAPTVLEIAGLRSPAGDGRSLAQVLASPDAAPADRVVLAQSLPYDLTGKQWRFIARSARAKCILPEQGDGSCFDVDADPDERHPLPPSPGFSSLHADAAAYRERAMAGIGGGAQPIADGAAHEVDAATQRKLQALGYTD